jgi:hypothetical protein
MQIAKCKLKNANLKRYTGDGQPFWTFAFCNFIAAPLVLLRFFVLLVVSSIGRTIDKSIGTEFAINDDTLH